MSPAPFPTSSHEHTALKWSSDGELSALDLDRIVRRLKAVDPVAEALVGLSGLHQGPGQCPGHSIAAGETA